MNSTRTPSTTATPPVEADGGRVSLRALYAEAMKDVMSDPLKAIAEYEPWLAALLPRGPKAPAA